MRLDHLLSKECYRLLSVVLIDRECADHYPVEHWLLGRSRITGRWLAAFDCLTSVRRPEPATHRSVPAKAFGLSLFRFEGVTHRVSPGVRPFGARLSPRRDIAGVSSRALRELLESPASVSPPRRSGLPRAGGDHSPRVCPGRADCSGCSLLLAYSTEGGDGVPALVCAVQPLENSKASTSIFVLQATKSQR